MFEEQKAAMDQRYRQLLEDSIQDAVFLSSRNSELTDENQNLRQRKTFSYIIKAAIVFTTVYIKLTHETYFHLYIETTCRYRKT